MLGKIYHSYFALNSMKIVDKHNNISFLIVCMLGHEMDTMRKNFELVQVELEQWKEKCGLIKAIA